jgi:hypothetical protein
MADLTRTEFSRRFADDQEIGRDITAARLEIYYDNGHQVGRWVEHRPSTRGHGELIDADQADAARDWCSRLRHQQREAATQAAECGR